MDKNLKEFFESNRNYIGYDERLCDCCLEEIKSNYEMDEMDKDNDDFWEENSQFSGIDPIDYLGG